MKKTLLVILTVFLCTPLFSQLPFTEDFEGGSGGYTVSTTEFTDNAGDYFLLTDGSNISGAYTGTSGSFFAAQDVDGEGAASDQTITWSGIDITGCSSISFSVDLAEDGPNDKWDLADFVHFDISIDGGAFTPLLWFENDGSTFNTDPQVDADFDGTGDGAALTSTWQTFTSAIAGSGSTLSIRVSLDLDSGDEDIAIDNISVTGTCAACGGLVAEPINEVSGEVITSITCTAASLSWVNGIGSDNTLVVMSTSAIVGSPVDGIDYDLGETIAAGEVVVFNGTGTSTGISGLAEGVTYFIKIFEYNGAFADCEENYLTGGVSISFTTLTGCVSSDPQIESILYNSCNGTSEGTDEIFTFVNGTVPLEVDSLHIEYPSGTDFCNVGCAGGNTNINNPTYISDLNTMAGCTIFAYADPIPAGAAVMVFTGNPPTTVLDYSSQCGAENLPIYAVFNSNSSTSGRFSNTAIRTLIVGFGNGAGDTVTYNGSAQSNMDGATANFDTDGNPTYFISSDCIYPLYVELVTFKAERVGRSIHVDWATQVELNNDFFVVEKSFDGTNFTSIGEVYGQGNSSELTKYSFIDQELFDGIVYYRLRQVDYNGNSRYSNVVYVSNNLISLYYYQGKIRLKLKNNQYKEGSVNIYALNGALVYQGKLGSNEVIDWDKKGFYIIEIPELDFRQKIVCH